MKKLAISVLLASASMAFADKQSNVGIGLGTEIFKGHDGLMSQTAAATTNGIFGNQTFAITSGTLGAEKPKEHRVQLSQACCSSWPFPCQNKMYAS